MAKALQQQYEMHAAAPMRVSVSEMASLKVDLESQLLQSYLQV